LCSNERMVIIFNRGRAQVSYRAPYRVSKLKHHAKPHGHVKVIKTYTFIENVQSWNRKQKAANDCIV
jgi:hypothetical protein